MLRKLVVGITGPLGAGRRAAAQYLEESGFEVRHLSDILRDEARKGGQQDPTVDDLQDLGDKLRKKRRRHVLAKMSLKGTGNRVAVRGIKNAGEAQWLERNVSDFYLLAIDASSAVRRERKVGVGEGKLTESAFDVAEQRDRGETDPWGVLLETGQQVDKCVHMADFVVWNDKLLLRGKGGPSSQDGSMDSLRQKLRRMLDTIDGPDRYRPSDRELFMGHAVLASRASECMRRQVGAALTSIDGRVLAVGCNDVPPPLNSCLRQYGVCHRRKIRDEQLQDLADRFRCKQCGGLVDKQLRCKKCNSEHSQTFERLRSLDLCRALHAEETVLLQLARSDSRMGPDLHLYTTTFPCNMCARRIVRSGIHTVFYIDPYPGQESFEALRESDTRVEHFEGFTLRGIEKVWGGVRPRGREVPS